MASLPLVMLWRSMLCVSEAPQPGSGGRRPGSSELPCTTFKPRACQTCALVSTCSTVQATSSRPQLAIYHRHWLHGQPWPTHIWFSQKLPRASKQELGTGFKADPGMEILPPECRPVLSHLIIILAAVWVAHCK